MSVGRLVDAWKGPRFASGGNKHVEDTNILSNETYNERAVP